MAESIAEQQTKADKEVDILEATKEFANTHGIPYDERIESMILNAMREAVKNYSTPDVRLLLRSNAIDFAQWLQHLDNGTVHYNPFTKEETESIGFSPNDCLMDGIYTVEELYDKWKELSNES